MTDRCILILLDGLADRTYGVLGGQTPLQAARTPTLDRLAAMGANGLYHATVQGEALPSENAHFAIFGYEPDSFPGRGALEALGAGIDLGPDDVALLAHFATVAVKDGLALLDNAKPKATQQEAQQIAAVAAEFAYNDIPITFTHTHALHGIITLGGEVAPYITDTDPMIAGRHLIAPQPFAGEENNAATCNTAAALAAYLKHLIQVLPDHPVNQARRAKRLEPINALVTQRAGRLKPVMAFQQRYGLKGLSMASGLVYHGLSRYLGLDCRKVTDSADPGADLAQRIKSAHKLSADYDFIHVHTKVPDEAGHTKDPVAKMKAIEALDAGLADAIGPLMADEGLLIVVTADHATPSAGPLIHSGETVPLIFFGQGVRCDAVQRYDEVAAAQGALGSVRGRELLLMILNALDRAKLQGLMDTPFNQPYFPGRAVPFNIN